MDAETGVERFDYDDPAVAFEAAFNADGTGHQAHTAPCAFTPAGGHGVLPFEEPALDGAVSTQTLRWYPATGLLAPPPVYVLRPPPGG